MIILPGVNFLTCSDFIVTIFLNDKLLKTPVSLYLSACLIVMQVHQATRSLFNFTGVHKATRKLDAILDVSRAAPPLPAFLLIVIPLLFPVAATVAQVALAACRSDGVGHSCRRDGIGKRCFPTT